MTDRIKFLINLAIMTALITAYTCNIAQAYSINIMFPPVTVCDRDDAALSGEKTEIRFMLADIVRNIFTKNK